MEYSYAVHVRMSDRSVRGHPERFGCARGRRQQLTIFLGAYAPAPSLSSLGARCRRSARSGIALLPMRARFAVEALIFAAFTWAAPVWAHNTEEVRRSLREQGYDQLEFSRTKPPFKLDACRGGERFHLHVDYYGKIIEETSIGSCDGDAAVPPAAAPPPGAAPTDTSSDEASSITSPAPAQPPNLSRDAEKLPKQAPARELCARYFPAVGKTLQVPCGQ